MRTPSRCWEETRDRGIGREEGNVETMREEMTANHQTISITVSGLAELAHSEYQVRVKTWKWLNVGKVVV